MDYSRLQSRPSSSSSYIPPHRTQLHPRMHPFFPSLSSTSKPSSPLQSQTKCLVLLAPLLTIPFLFYIISTAQKIHLSPKFSELESKLFGVVINAGPSGSQVRVFEFLGEDHIPFMDGSGSTSLTVKPGLVECAEEPENAARSIARLMKFARRTVPRKDWSNTKLYLMAGPELESLGVQLTEKILESCRQVLRSSGFVFKDNWARVVQDKEKGLYTWVSANYALGILGGEPEETAGIVALSGASVQVAFATNGSLELQSSHVMKLFGVTYNVHIRSFPQLGQEAAWKSLLDLHHSGKRRHLSNSSEGISGNPCIPRGYKPKLNAKDATSITYNPAGNFSACKFQALAYLNQRLDKCSTAPCKIMPSFELPGKPVSPDNFLFATEFFGLITRDFSFDLEESGQHYCEEKWVKLKNQHPRIDDAELLRHCFSSAYLTALMHDSLGFSVVGKRIRLANQTRSIPLDWTLGAFITETMLEPISLESDNLDQIVQTESVTYFTLFALLLIVILVAFFALQCRKPQLKTIYDLEKGRYIVTRVPSHKPYSADNPATRLLYK